MLRNNGQKKLSEYRSLYDIIIPADNIAIVLHSGVKTP